jgi:hypothetical protein
MPVINNSLKYITDSHQSLFTILIYNTPLEQFINDVKNRLNKLKDINNAFKKKKINERLYKLLVDLENKNNIKNKDNVNIINSIILIADNITYINLTNDDIKLLNEYNIPKYTFEYDDYFKIDWLKDLFENFVFYNFVIFNSNTFTHYEGNLNKKKLINKSNSIDYINNLQVKFFLFGKIKMQLSTKNLINHFTLPDNIIVLQDIFGYIEKYNMKNKINVLDNIIKNVSVNPDLYVFGDEIYEMIESYNLKELYLHKNIKTKFDKIIIDKNLSDNINFSILEIDSIGEKDSSSDLINNYGGMIGIKYY